MRKPLTCYDCGETWDTDPRLAVDCPHCQQPAGSPCLRPSGHPASEPHREREQLAVDRAFMSMCAAAPETVKRADLFGNVIDTHATEAELNGWRASQGQLL